MKNKDCPSLLMIKVNKHMHNKYFYFEVFFISTSQIKLHTILLLLSNELHEESFQKNPGGTHA